MCNFMGTLSSTRFCSWAPCHNLTAVPPFAFIIIYCIYCIYLFFSWSELGFGHFVSKPRGMETSFEVFPEQFATCQSCGRRLEGHRKLLLRKRCGEWNFKRASSPQGIPDAWSWEIDSAGIGMLGHIEQAWRSTQHTPRTEVQAKQASLDAAFALWSDLWLMKNCVRHWKLELRVFSRIWGVISSWQLRICLDANCLEEAPRFSSTSLDLYTAPGNKFPDVPLLPHFERLEVHGNQIRNTGSSDVRTCQIRKDAVPHDRSNRQGGAAQKFVQ